MLHGIVLLIFITNAKGLGRPYLAISTCNRVLKKWGNENKISLEI